MWSKLSSFSARLSLGYALLGALVVGVPAATGAAEITRVSDSGNQAGAVSRIAVEVLGPGAIATAVRDGGGNLKLIGWFVGPTTTRSGDSANQAGKVKEIAMVNLGHLVTAVRTGDDRLKLISWKVTPNADPMIFERLGDSGSQAGKVSRIDAAIVPIPTALRLVTAVRTGGGDLKLIAWDMSSGGAFTRLGDSGSQAGSVDRVQISAVGQKVLVTAVRTAQGTLKLITWKISGDGTSIQRIADSGSQAGAVGDIALSDNGTLTAVETSSGTLKLIRWSISPDGTDIDRIGDSGNQAGKVNTLSLSRVGNHYLTGVETGGGDLKLIAWQTGAGGAVTRTGDSGGQAGAVSRIALTKLPGSSTFASAVRDGGGNLKVLAWDVDF